MIEHPFPKPSTVKRLFAVSGNQCAFEKCEISLVDYYSGKVTGRICHINARRENGPRFLDSQSEVENRHFDNLILMCPIHHDVIDSDIKSYTEERLKEIKKEHEAKFLNEKLDIDKDKLNKLIQNINIESIKINSFFAVSNNRGQIANQIVNNPSDNAKLFVLERKISSLRKLESIYEYILPKKISPDMDWSDVIEDIAYSFDPIRKKILEFKLEYSGFIDENIESMLNDCMLYCTEGQFGVNIRDCHLTKEGYEYAESLYEKVAGIMDVYKKEIRDYINNNA